MKTLTVNQLCERWHTSIPTLSRWRKEGKGPRWFKVEGKILYPIESVEEYENADA